jgi:hypothetical protein
MDDELPLVDDPDVAGRDEASEDEEAVDEAPKNDVPRRPRTSPRWRSEPSVDQPASAGGGQRSRSTAPVTLMTVVGPA